MILLDTNVLSALMRERPDAAVLGWMDRQNPLGVWTTSVTVFDIRYGLSRIPDGRRRRALEGAFGDLLREEFQGRVAVFDRAAADAAGALAARREAAGRNVDFRDTMVAGIALARRGRVAIRNVPHFDDLANGVVSPWEA